MLDKLTGGTHLGFVFAAISHSNRRQSGFQLNGFGLSSEESYWRLELSFLSLAALLLISGSFSELELTLECLFVCIGRKSVNTLLNLMKSDQRIKEL